jgi:hypothetical protein
VCEERSDDFGSVLGDETLACSSDCLGEEVAEVFHDKIVDVKLVDSGVLFYGSEKESADKALEVGAEIADFGWI